MFCFPPRRELASFLFQLFFFFSRLCKSIVRLWLNRCINFFFLFFFRLFNRMMKLSILMIFNSEFVRRMSVSFGGIVEEFFYFTWIKRFFFFFFFYLFHALFIASLTNSWNFGMNLKRERDKMVNKSLTPIVIDYFEHIDDLAEVTSSGGEEILDSISNCRWWKLGKLLYFYHSLK